MGRASLFDVFYSGANAAAPFLGEKTRKLKEQNDFDLRMTAQKFSNDFQDYLRKNPYDGGDIDEYQKKLQQYNKSWYETNAAGNTSQYYQKNAAQMSAETGEAARGSAMAQEGAWKLHREGVDLELLDTHEKTFIENYKRDNPFDDERLDDSEYIKERAAKFNKELADWYEAEKEREDGPFKKGSVHFQRAVGEMEEASLALGERSALEDEDASRRRVENLLYSNITDLLNEEAERYLRINPYNGNGERYFKEYMEKVMYSMDEAYAKAWDKNDIQKLSPNIRTALNNWKRKSDAGVMRIVQERADERRMKQDAEDFHVNMRHVLESDWEPERKRTSFRNHLEQLKMRMFIDPETEGKMLRGFDQELYEKFAAGVMAEVNDVNLLDGAIKAIRGRFSFMDDVNVYEYDAEGNIVKTETRPWTSVGWDGFEQGLVEQRTKEIQGEHWNRVIEANAYVERLTALGDLDGALKLANEYRPLWNKAYDKNDPAYNNFSDDHRVRGKEYFPVGKMEGFKAQGQEGKLAAMWESPRMLLRPLIEEGSVVVRIKEDDGRMREVPLTTLNDVKNHLVAIRKNAFEYEYEQKHGPGTATGFFASRGWEEEQEKYTLAFNTAVKELINELCPQLWDEYEKFQKIITYNKAASEGIPNQFYNKNIFEDKKLTDLQKDQFAQNSITFFTDMFWNTELFREGVINISALREAMRTFTGQSLVNILEWRSTPSQKGNYFKNLADYSAEAMSEQAEHVVYTDIRDKERWRSERIESDAKAVRGDEQNNTAALLRLQPDELKPAWMQSSRNKNDIIPKGIFVVEKGEKAGTYYMDYDEKANQVVMKQNPATGRWEEHARENRPLTATENYVRLNLDMREIKNSLSIDKVNPYTKEPFNFEEAPPPNYTGSISAWKDRRNSKESKLAAWVGYFLQQGQKN